MKTSLLAYINIKAMGRVSAGGLGGCQVTGCHSSEVLNQVYLSNWHPSCSGRILLTDHHEPALPCFPVKWILQATLWIYPKGQRCWFLLRGCSLSPLLSHLPLWQSRNSPMHHTSKTESFLIFFWALKPKCAPLCYLIFQVLTESQPDVSL